MIPTSRHSRAICPDATAVCGHILRCRKPIPRFSIPATTKPWFAPALEYATAVGAFYDTRDLKVVKEGSEWKVEWPVAKEANVPPQVIQENYLRWDVIARGANDDWGAQNVEAPRVRIISMNAIPQGNNTIIVGEIENEDTVPGFVSVGATLIGKDGGVLGEETSFDKISHTSVAERNFAVPHRLPERRSLQGEERAHAAEFNAGARFG